MVHLRGPQLGHKLIISQRPVQPNLHIPIRFLTIIPGVGKAVEA